MGCRAALSVSFLFSCALEQSVPCVPRHGWHSCDGPTWFLSVLICVYRPTPGGVGHGGLTRLFHDPESVVRESSSCRGVPSSYPPYLIAPC